MSKRSKNRKPSRQGKIAVQRTVSLSEDDARIRLTALTLLPGKA